ncbi:MAG: response regulator [Anaerolineae bacterium]|jgi:pilus assembly protein CpaE|nr:response regulator [Anaerolineae bacterium]
MSEKILIVDDDIDSLKLIGLMLQRQGYQVIAANAGAQALSKAHAELPDLIILDVMMPDMNGYEVCKRLRNHPDTKTIPIIMFTAKTLIDDKVAGFEAGADDYLTKPTHPAELAARVRQMLARSPHRPTQERRNTAGKTIGVIGAKGGIGTSTVVLNVGASLAQNNGKPIIADFRLGSGSLGLMLGITRATGMGNVLSRPASDIRGPLVEKEIAVHQSGIRALLSSTRIKEAQLNYTIETALAVIQVLKNLGDPVIFDLGTGYHTLNSRLLAQMDRIIVIAEPITITLEMAQELVREIETDLKKQVEIVVVNRNASKVQLPWHEVESILGREILAIIAAAPEIAFHAIETGTPMVLQEPGAIVSSQLMKLAEDVYTS